MKRTLAALAIIAGLHSVPAASETALKVCLNEDAPPLSAKRKGEARGFDVEVARAVAHRLGRELEIQWFESEVDDDSNPVTEANALLSDGRCDLVGGYALFATALGEPTAGKARLPDYDGARRSDRGRWIPLNTVAASRPYRLAPMAVLLGPRVSDRRVGSLSDLEGLKLGVEGGTLGGAILLSYQGGRLVDSVVHLGPRQDLFETLESGEIDATLIELNLFDAYKAGHPETDIVSSGHYHSISYNIGFLGLARDDALLADVGSAIDQLLGDGEIARLATETGVTFLRPRQPDVLPAISQMQLKGD